MLNVNTNNYELFARQSYIAKYIVTVILTLLVRTTCRAQGNPSVLESEISVEETISIDTAKSQRYKFQPLPRIVKEQFFKKELGSHVLVDPGYRVWGLSVIPWDDGSYHAYYARWPESLGHGAWLSHCEIAHAESDRPEGPFVFKNVVLGHHNPGGWDVSNAHNPNVCISNWTINLYYISNDLNGKFEKENDNNYPSIDWFGKNWNLVRNTQRIGVARATSPEGPFIRSKRPVVEPHGAFKNIAVNPAVAYVNGTYVMIMKGDDVKVKDWHRIQLVGHATNAEGPFTFNEEPVYDKAQTEDAGIWYDKRTEDYYMACHVMNSPDLALFTSKNGHQWRQADNPLFKKKEIELEDGSIWKPDRVERPFILTDAAGKPIMLYVAIADKGVTGNIAIPFE